MLALPRPARLCQVRIVLNKADSVDPQQLMRVYGALMWSLGKVFRSPEVCRVYIGRWAWGPHGLEDTCVGGGPAAIQCPGYGARVECLLINRDLGMLYSKDVLHAAAPRRSVVAPPPAVPLLLAASMRGSPSGRTSTPLAAACLSGSR